MNQSNRNCIEVFDVTVEDPEIYFVPIYSRSRIKTNSHIVCRDMMREDAIEHGARDGGYAQENDVVGA